MAFPKPWPDRPHDRLLAARSGQLLKVAGLGSEIGLPHSTVARYLSLLEMVFLIERIPAWSRNLSRRATCPPKVTMVDSGIAANLLDVDAELFHYRTRDQIEVNAASTVRPDDFRGLRHRRNRLGDDFLVGLVLYTGRRTLPFGDSLRAMPISSLWDVPAPA